MKPQLLNKTYITKIIDLNKKIINNNINEIILNTNNKNNNFFNFLIISFFIFCILFLIYIYIEKKNIIPIYNVIKKDERRK